MQLELEECAEGNAYGTFVVRKPPAPGLKSTYEAVASFVGDYCEGGEELRGKLMDTLEAISARRIAKIKNPTMRENAVENLYARFN